MCLIRHFARSAFSVAILKISYGIDVDDEDHELLRTVGAALAGAGQTFVPGRFLVDTFPVLQHVPAWLPCAGFQKKFAIWREDSKKIRELPFSERNKAFVSGFTRGCISSGLTACADSQRHTL